MNWSKRMLPRLKAEQSLPFRTKELKMDNKKVFAKIFA